MLYDPQNFLHSYCQYAAARAATSLSPALVINYATAFGSAKWNLFLNQAHEIAAADPYGVLIGLPGSHERNNPKPTLAMQLAVYGSSNLAANNLANGLFRAFCLTNQEVELRMIALPGFKLADNSGDGSWVLVDAIVQTMPGQVGRDDRGLVKLVSKFDMGFYKAS